MLCKYLSKEGLCTGRYTGYACIRKQCSYQRESKDCEYHDPTGDYCRKFGRFGCVGRENCGTLASYLESLVAEEEPV